MPTDDAFERPDPAVVRAFARFPASIVGDALGRNSCLAGALRPLVPGARLCGPALTVRCYPGDNLMCHHGVEIAAPGDVLIVDGAGYTEGALWGGLLTRTAIKRGLAGVVVDGAARDADELRELGLPIYARAVTPRGVFKARAGEAAVPVTCGGVVVHPGDLVLGDGDGVVVVPRARLGETLSEAERTLLREAELAAEIDRGGTIYRMLGLERLVKG
jgi:4-hydroxy-4-methyl-2-oxoglutarate aldolase